MPTILPRRLDPRNLGAMALGANELKVKFRAKASWCKGFYQKTFIPVLLPRCVDDEISRFQGIQIMSNFFSYASLYYGS